MKPGCWQGKTALWRGETALAGSLLAKCTELMIGMNDRVNIAYPLEAMASLVLQQKDLKQAARLFGAADHHFRLIRNTFSQSDRERRAEDLARLHAELGE